MKCEFQTRLRWYQIVLHFDVRRRFHCAPGPVFINKLAHKRVSE